MLDHTLLCISDNRAIPTPHRRIVAQVHAGEGTLTQVGTPMYIAPEVLIGDKHYTNKADAFSFGLVVLHTMSALDYGGLVGCWGGGHLVHVGVRMAMGARPAIPPKLRNEMPGLSALVERCWDVEPGTRPTFAEIVAQLRDRATRSCTAGSDVDENSSAKLVSGIKQAWKS